MSVRLLRVPLILFCLAEHLLDNAFLLKPDARQVFEGAYELFTYDRDVEEFLHTVGRILRA